MTHTGVATRLAIMGFGVAATLWAGETIVPRPSVGEYLSVAYVRSLQHCRTPSEAKKPSGAFFARATQRAAGDVELTLGNFHEGIAQIVLDQAGHSKVIYPKDADLKYQIHTRDEFSVAIGSSLPVIFRHIGDIDEFLAELFIMGVYQTQDGRRYVFGKGEADLDGRQVSYAVDSDAEEGMDIVRVGDSRYRFRRANRDLLLYADLSAPTAARPDLRLTYIARFAP